MKQYSPLVMFSVFLSLVLITPNTRAEDNGWSLSGDITLASEYRWRGFSLSDEDPVPQMGLMLSHDSGFYIKAWSGGTSALGDGIDLGADVEFAVFTGYNHKVSDATTLNFQFVTYTFPGNSDLTYFEVYSQVNTKMQNLSVNAGVAWGWEQENNGDRENLYLFTNLSHPLGDSGLSINGHIGYEEGAYGDRIFGKDKWDWSLGFSGSWRSLTYGVTYIDTNIASDVVDGAADATVLLTLTHAF